MKYKIMYWLFFGGEDKVEKQNLSKDEANSICKELNDKNGDALYSGFYVKEQENT